MSTVQILERIATALEAARPTRTIMDSKEAAAYLGVHTNTLSRLVYTYRLPCSRLTARGGIRFFKSDLDEWLKNRRVNGLESHKRMLKGDRP